MRSFGLNPAQLVSFFFLSSHKFRESRSSQPLVFCIKCFLKNFEKLTRKLRCQSLFLNELAGIWCFPKNLKKVLRTNFFMEYLWCHFWPPPVAFSEILQLVKYKYVYLKAEKISFINFCIHCTKNVSFGFGHIYWRNL